MQGYPKSLFKTSYPTMVLKNIPPQDDMLYSRKWTKSMDHAFIEYLVEQRRLGNWAGRNERNYHAIATAVGKVNDDFGKTLSYEDAVARVEFLRDRYDCFKDIVSTVNTYWSKELNTVHTDDQTWRFIIRVSPNSSSPYSNKKVSLIFPICYFYRVIVLRGHMYTMVSPNTMI